MRKSSQLLIGVEDTLVLSAPHGRGGVKLTLENFCAHVDALVEQGLGNLYAVRGYMLHPDAHPREMLASKKCVTDDPDGDLVKLLEYAAKRGVYSMTIYTAMTKCVVSALKCRCGKYYLGNNLGEATMSPVPAGKRDMRQAARAWVKRMRAITRRQWAAGQPHVTCTLTNLLAKYCMEAGMDIATGEIFTLPCVNVQYALLRGATRGYERALFGAWCATGWFSGNNLDPQKPGRWRLALNAGFLNGSNILIQESGHWGLYEFRDFEDEDHPLCRTFRKIQRDFVEFARANPRPAQGPTVNVGLVHGNLDGYKGREGHIWDQPGWLPGNHERSWELLNVFYPAAGPVADHVGLQDRRRSRFSGTPYGLADIVPAEAPPSALCRYRSLLFLGWNTMTDEQYQNLIEYVRGGGRLVMWAAHLGGSASLEKADVKQRFYRNGDFRDLFGVRVHIPPKPRNRGGWRSARTMINTVRWVRAGTHRFPVGKTYYINWPHGGVVSELAADVHTLAVTDRGHPFVTERKLGKGRAVLVHAYSPQGHPSYRELAEDIFHTVGKRERSAFRVEGNPKLSYAIYGRGRHRTLYVLNTSLAQRQRATVVGLSRGPREIRVPATCLVRIDWE